MKSDNTVFYIILTLTMITLVVASATLGYQWGLNSCEDANTPFNEQNMETYIYDLEKGKDGIIRFSVDKDSLAYVIFVQNNDTFGLDALNKSEFDSLLNVLYPESPVE